MKKIIFIILAMTMALAASAQYADKDLIVKNGHIYSDGVRLSDDQSAACFRDIYGTDRSGDYLKYAQGYRRGLVMLVGIPTLTKNSARLNNLAAYHNTGRSRSAEVSLGPTSGGIGLALNF